MLILYARKFFGELKYIFFFASSFVSIISSLLRSFILLNLLLNFIDGFKLKDGGFKLKENKTII